MAVAAENDVAVGGRGGIYLADVLLVASGTGLRGTNGTPPIGIL